MINTINTINTIAIVSGEHSGDNYGRIIIEKLKSKYPNANFIGVGGPKMIQSGLKTIFPMEKISVIGVFNVLKKLPELIKLKKLLISKLISHKIDLYIGIDSPDFNLRIAKKLKKISNKHNYSIKTVQYISPTVWAWRPKRIYKVAAATDTVLCIFPFEKQIYTNNNIRADFVGHPLAENIKNRDFNDIKISRDKIYNINHENNKLIISLFPGSRISEINSLAPVFIETAVKLYNHNNNIRFIIPIVSEKLYQAWNKIYTSSDLYKSFRNSPDVLKLIKLYNKNDLSSIESIDVMKASDIILCSSGTTTLEAFLLGVPMVVAYKVSKLNELLIRLLIKVNYVAMPNILSDKLFNSPIVPEFLQDKVTVDNLYKSIIEQLDNYYYKTNKQANINLLDKWHKIQNYLKSDNNLDHGQAILNSIEKLYDKK